ncbi:MAG: hypothetical protein NTV51_14730 [Verrucomicrobia bacterium]|nr:hypothetical protein [Verrucomicrobiota bacterium]
MKSSEYTDKSNADKGTVSWNDEAIIEYPDSGQVAYMFRLHVREKITDPQKVAEYLAKLANPTNDQIASIIRDAPFRILEQALIAQRYSDGKAAGWTFRFYYDGNADVSQNGHFVELEFTQTVTDDAQRRLVSDYLTNKGPGRAKDDLTNSGLLTDNVVLAAIGLK